MPSDVDPRHARYPFLDGAREAVRRLDVAPAELAATDAPAVERGVERVRRALMAGSVAAAEPGRWRPRDELLSYPVARVLVSLVDDDAVVRKYADAEAATARERLAADLDGDRPGAAAVGVADALDAFGLGDEIRHAGGDGPARESAGGGGDAGELDVDVAAYLRLSDPSWGAEWRLVERALTDGRVPVARDELLRLLEAAARERVVDGLPIAVGGDAGETLTDALADEVAEIRALVDDRSPRPDVDVVVPERFPPCVRALLDRARAADDELAPRSRLALLAFLADIGVDADGMTELTGIDPDTVEYPAAVLCDGSRSQYPGPSCATMQAQGDCVDPDERCERITHPIAYYRDALDDAPPG